MRAHNACLPLLGGQAMCLARIKKEGIEAKKAQQRALTAKRTVPKVHSPTPVHERPKASLADFMAPQVR